MHEELSIRSPRGRRQSYVARQPSAFFCQYLLECVDFEHALGEQALEPTILLFSFLKTLCLNDAHASICLAPAVECRLGNAVFATHSTNGLFSPFGLFQDLDNLFGG